MEKWLEFFFEALTGHNSYVGGGKAIPIPDMPGWKGFTVAQGDLKLVDRYTSPTPGNSIGHIILWEDGRTRLYLGFGGHYPKAAIPCLKGALGAAHKKRLFVGGRGPHRFVSDDGLYLYQNVYISHASNRPAQWEGLEHIVHVPSGTKVGHHHYWGMRF